MQGKTHTVYVPKDMVEEVKEWIKNHRQMRFERLADAFTQNLAKLSGQDDLDTVADPDTLAHYAERPAESMRHHRTSAILAMPGQIRFQPP